MNQIFSVILVIVMAFSSMAGVTAGIEGAVSFDAKISMDTEAVLNLAAASGTDVPEEAKQGYKVAGDILNALTLKGTATKDTAELALLAGEDVALSIGMKADEKGTTVASNLLSTDVIFVSAELIEQMNIHNEEATENGGIVIALGMARYEKDEKVIPVYERADERMYKNKSVLKAKKQKG